MATPAGGGGAAAPTSAAKKKGSGIMASFFDLEVGCSPLQLVELSIVHRMAEANKAFAKYRCRCSCFGCR